MRGCLLVVCWACVASGRSLPGSLGLLEPVTLPGVWEELVHFFRYESAYFHVAVDATCVSETLEGPIREKRGARPFRFSKAPGEAALTHPKWSAEVWLPLMLARSEWGLRTERKANATFVVYRSRARGREELSKCARLLSARSANFRETRGANYWFPAISSRGPCCDGGQVRDPGLMRHHFIGHSGERSEGPWLFREARFADHLRRTSQYKAPATRDTSPKLRCYDGAKDIAIPPPSVLLRKEPEKELLTEADRVEACLASRGRDAQNCYLVHDFQEASSKSILVAHAEGRQGGLEYDLRRSLTEFWDPNFHGKKRIHENNVTRETRSFARNHPDKIRVAFSLPFRNYSAIMRRSKFCVVSEGYSPWSPRLAEAIAIGCVPAILSPLLEPPYSATLDWSKFSVRLTEEHLPSLPAYLETFDHAALHANLLRVQPLFFFCVDEGGEDHCGGGRGDALPLVVFEMAKKTKGWAANTNKAFKDDVAYSQNGTYAGFARLAATHGQQRRPVSYACRLTDGACLYTFNDESWLCSMVNSLHCECAKKKQEGKNQWNFVGTTDNLRGHKPYLWARGGPTSPIVTDTTYPNDKGIPRYQPGMTPQAYLQTAATLENALEQFLTTDTT